MPLQPEVLCNWRSFKSLVSPVISLTIHPQAEVALGFPNILFSTLSTRYQVNHIHCSAVSTVLQSYSRPIRRLGYMGRRYHIAGSTSWSATGLAFAIRLSGFSLALTRRSLRLLGLLIAIIGFCGKTEFR